METEGEPAGLLRRLGALLYDGLLLVALLLVASYPLVLAAGGPPARGGGLQLAYRLGLLAVTFLFFAWFWTHGGQTLGMRAWRVRLVSADGGPVRWGQAARRFLAAFLSAGCLGLGFLWALRDPERRAWHDLLSGTRLRHLPRPRPAGRS